MPPPAQPKIYHIVHIDRLSSITADRCLWSDAEMIRRQTTGTTIGMTDIKRRRLNELVLTSYPDLKVGDCVPFYFCPRSVMLYLLWQGNHPNLTYRDGQGPIVHLEADLYLSVSWGEQNGRRWAFTLSNAGSYYFEDRCSLNHLEEINWDAVTARRWSGRGIATSVKEGKQAEFLMHQSFPWHLVERVGVYTRAVAHQVAEAMQGADYRPVIEVRRDWYY
jgi:hypothetical protein